jgi:hypothetical protein
MKLLLAATTALVSVVSALAGSLPTRVPTSGYRGLDANQEFLCNYGFKIVASFYHDSENQTGGWIHAATPIYGKGNTISEITVEEGPPVARSDSQFSVALYSSYKDKPNKVLVSARADQQVCGLVGIPIPPIQLAKGQKYWIVEALKASEGLCSCSRATDTVTWYYDKKRTHGALFQSGTSCYGSWCACPSSCSSHTQTKWKHITGGVPYARVGPRYTVLRRDDLSRSQSASDRAHPSPGTRQSSAIGRDLNKGSIALRPP